jgi:hypothetical protein
MSKPGKTYHHRRSHQGRRAAIGLGDDVCGFRLFPRRAAGVSWELTARRQGIATPRQGMPCPGQDPVQTGRLLIAARSPVMSIIAWIVPGLGAGLLANLSAASTRGRPPL